MIGHKKRALQEENLFHYHDSDQQITEYLRASPDFFARNPELLLEIEVPHHERGAVSLVERRLTMHREQCSELRERLDEIVNVAQQNDNLAELLHYFSLGLISADSLGDVLQFTQSTLRSRLDCEEMRVVLFENDLLEACLDDAPASVRLADAGFARSVAALHTRRPVYCGYMSAPRLRQFFPGTVLDIRSASVIRLVHETPVSSVDIGYLALASENRSRFAPHMGTEFLARFGSLLSARLAVFFD
jgi:uncharacterized protein YigA (DUF484 family)